MSDVQSRILDYLKDKHEVPTLMIAKYVIGPKATKKSINTHLYAMERSGLVKKTCEENGGNPRWTLLSFTETEHHQESEN